MNHKTPGLRPQKRAKARAVSYDEMQALGLSRAIDEYHKLLNAGLQNGESHRRKPSPSASVLVGLVNTTIARPLPSVLAPENFIALVTTLWSIIASVLYCSIAIMLPIALWLCLAPPPRILVPSIIFQPRLSLSMVNLDISKGFYARLAALMGYLVVLRVAEATVVSRAVACRNAEHRNLTPQDLEAWYRSMGFDSTRQDGVPIARNTDTEAAWTSASNDLINEVRQLAQQYDDVGSPSIMTSADALKWLERVGHDAGVAIPKGVEDGDVNVGLQSARKLKQVLLE